MTATAQFDTVSERYFADYLDDAKHDWVHHPNIPGQLKKPDFVFSHSGVQVLCDLKERTPNAEQLEEQRLEGEAIEAGEPNQNNPRHFNPVKEVRHSIAEGRSKFKDFDGHLCALIVYNMGRRDMRLDPYTIFGAMLGNPGVGFNLNVETGVVDIGSLQSGFLPRGGAMIRKYAPLTPSKSLRNISAVVALEPYHIPNPLFEDAFNEEMERQKSQLERPLSGEERATIHNDLIIDHGMHASLGNTWGLTVCTNPFASIPFPNDLFTGPYDEHWSIVDDQMTRVFVGEQRLALDQPNDGDIDV